MKKFANWFNCYLNLRTASEHSSLYQLILAIIYYPLLLACLMSPWLLPTFRKLELYFSIQYLMAAAAYSIFFTRVRYRLPYDYLILILASGVCAALIESFTYAGQTSTLQHASLEASSCDFTKNGRLTQ